MSDDNRLWDFALKIYSDPEVAATCLRLQDDFGLSVNRLLFAIWLAREKRLLGGQLLDDRQLSEWHDSVLLPLRQLRYRVREQRQQQSLDKQGFNNCYQQFKQAELEAERVELNRLYQLADDCCASERDLSDLARSNLRACLQHRNIKPSASLEALLEMLIIKLKP
ncbi:TIGR02444 family protein [Amphritea sp. HPY]|uniref:TIGR02444 family protein n=1 Tax=Amphritea sp. HPY TaxID=3421652 RepID=UPI003D7DF112